MGMRVALALLCLLSTAGRVGAEPQTIRIALLAPDGTAWAREFRAFAEDVRQRTGGEVTVKPIFGGVLGDAGATDDDASKDDKPKSP